MARACAVAAAALLRSGNSEMLSSRAGDLDLAEVPPGSATCTDKSSKCCALLSTAEIRGWCPNLKNGTEPFFRGSAAAPANDMGPYSPDTLCTPVEVVTGKFGQAGKPRTCQQYCSSYGLLCAQSRDDGGPLCTLDTNDAAYVSKGTVLNGCLHKAGRQVCQCADPSPSFPTPAPTPSPCGLAVNVCEMMNSSSVTSICGSTAADGSSFDVAWNQSNSMGQYAGWQMCTATVTTKQRTCAEFCHDQGLTCVQGMDNDHYDTLGFGTQCMLYPPQFDNQSTALNGCVQEWSTQICQCGAPPACPTTTGLNISDDRRCTNSSSCTIYDDPHVTVFDGPQVSLLSHEDAAAASNASEVWLVNSADVHIQARYALRKDASLETAYVRKVAVGGPFLGNRTLVIGSLADDVAWDGRAIWRTQGPYGRLEEEGLLTVRQSMAGRVIAELPQCVRLTVTRKASHVDVEISMPQAPGGQAGVCGNHNGFAFDDSMGMGGGSAVSAAASLFAGRHRSFGWLRRIR